MTPQRYDLAITGGDVVLDGGEPTRVDIGVVDGRIATLTDQPIDADEQLDATGRIVLPGVVDEHFHVFRGYPWETYENATRAAAKGGVTTVVDMPLDQPTTVTAAALEDKLAAIEHACHVDYATFGGYLPEDPDEMTAMAAAGAGCFKLFTGGVAPPGMYPGVDDGQLLDALRRAAALGLTTTVHCENAGIVDFETARLQGEGRTDMAAWDDARPWFAEVAAAHTVALLAKVTGARVVIAHASSPQTVEMVAAMRRQGADVWSETCHHYLCSTKDDARKDGRLKWNPPTREADQVARLWELVKSGDVHAIGTDHAPLPNVAGADVWDQLPGAGNAVEIVLPVFATDAIHTHGLTFGRVAELMSATPAKLFGLYPRKGAIRIGSDADLVVVDPDGSKVLDAAELEYHQQEKWSPFHGRTLRVLPLHTVLRGRVIVRDGEVLGTPGDGVHLRPEPSTAAVPTPS
ncbi:amidohydrolase family protein [Baekduia soli]|uniref:Amidohydrolase family protein n=1 Tax=Baekduia soli TaxID=496014 RepID=A0A5B8U3H9_9ACTN|nr:amidohydrolase family protein [Baekduia soli]QEC47405.1 amidohydrolase family protein [Baekduia soli]